MANTLKPATPEQVLETLQWAVSDEVPLEVRGTGSRGAFGRPVQSAHVLDLSALSGISDYQPGELNLTAGPATPVKDILAALDKNDQEMAFEPMDLGPLLGGLAGEGSIGGLVAANLSGPRRLKSGAARDHFLGFNAVSGRGEVFKSGGRVMKNVTGFDLSKLMAGSFGTLAVMTEVTLKVLPKAEKTRTVLVKGLDGEEGRQVLSAALGSPHEISAAAHLPKDIAALSKVGYVRDGGTAMTALRIEGPGPSVEYRASALRDMFKDFGETEELHSTNSESLWREVRDASFFCADMSTQVWRISVPPTDGPEIAARLTQALGGQVYFDWGGGLLWLAVPASEDAGAKAVRDAIAITGGHATLVRAAADVRSAVEVFQPQAEPVHQLTKRIKDAFDPKGILNPGRMYQGV